MKHSLAATLHPYFYEYLSIQKGLSQNTILAYRDALKQLFCFAADIHKTDVDVLDIKQIDEDTVLKFLKYIEMERQVSIATRNARLSAIKVFFAYLSRRFPALMAQCKAIREIRKKRDKKKTMSHLDEHETRALLHAVDCSQKHGLRDRALILLMLNTGARAQEIVDLDVLNVRLDAPLPQVNLTGKGQKQRTTPLWKDTVKALREYFEWSNRTQGPCFTNARGKRLTRYGIFYLVKKYVRRAQKSCPSLKTKNVGPHTLRHTTAMFLLRAGNDIAMVSLWLGHAHINTTHCYVEIDLELKRKMLGDKPLLKERKRGQKPWKKKGVLTWLKELAAP